MYWSVDQKINRSSAPYRFVGRFRASVFTCGNRDSIPGDDKRMGVVDA